MARSVKRTDRDHYESDSDLGYYRRTSLDEIINNFIIMYVGNDKVLRRVPRHEVAAVGQRSIQEFSYDTFHAESNIELELNDARIIQLPPDYVNYVEVKWVDPQGLDRIMTKSRRVRRDAGSAALQDGNYEYIYDEEGNIIEADRSEQIKRFQDPQLRDEAVQIASNSSSTNITDYNYSYYNESYYGRQWGIEPSEVNVNGTFVIDEQKGQIYIDYRISAGTVISLRYISDGLGEAGDLTKVYVPKMAEDAIYSRMLYDLTKVRPSAAGAAPLYKREAKAKMNNAKIRLMQLKTQEMEQVFRNKSKWIKH